MAGSRGGALAIEPGVVATLELVRILGNQAGDGGGIRSAGGDDDAQRHPDVESLHGSGGGMYFASGSAEITRTIFQFNEAGTLGGGLYQASGSVAMRDVNMLANTAVDGFGTRRRHSSPRRHARPPQRRDGGQPRQEGWRRGRGGGLGRVGERHALDQRSGDPTAALRSRSPAAPSP